MVLAVVPTGAINGVTRIPRTAAAQAVSPFTGTVQTQLWGAQWWEYSIEFWSQTGDDALALMAFLTNLNGPESEFLFADPAQARTDNVGAGQIAGASQTGRSVTTDTWSNSTLIFKAGQMLHFGSDIGTRSHMVTADVTSSGTGTATLPIWPALRESPADNSVIEYQAPAVKLKLAGPVPQVIDPHASYRVSFDARESV